LLVVVAAHSLVSLTFLHSDEFYQLKLQRNGIFQQTARGDVKIAAFDVLAIVKGMVDAAGEREETNAPQLERRVRRAVLGYLSTR